MDSLTQILLGAAVAEAAIGKTVGRRALVWGGLAGLLPDLDVIIPYGDAVKDVTFHRSFTHSFIGLTLLSPFIAWIIVRVHKKDREQNLFRRWWWAMFLSLITHTLLDCFTIYGTQVFWPFQPPPVTLSSIFIIDPIYSIPLFAGTLCAFFVKRNRRLAHLWCNGVLAFSTIYLGTSFAIKQHVDSVVSETIREQGISAHATLSGTAPFNILLWRILIMDENNYYVGQYSVFDKDRSIDLEARPHHHDILEPLKDDWAVKRLQWFTKGFYRARWHENDLVITDLRMGQEGWYVFSFVVGTRDENGNVQTLTPSVRRVAERPSSQELWRIWERIWEKP